MSIHWGTRQSVENIMTWPSSGCVLSLVMRKSPLPIGSASHPLQSSCEWWVNWGPQMETPTIMTEPVWSRGFHMFNASCSDLSGDETHPKPVSETDDVISHHWSWGGSWQIYLQLQDSRAAAVRKKNKPGTYSKGEADCRTFVARKRASSYCSERTWRRHQTVGVWRIFHSGGQMQKCFSITLLFHH